MLGSVEQPVSGVLSTMGMRGAAPRCVRVGALFRRHRVQEVHKQPTVLSAMPFKSPSATQRPRIAIRLCAVLRFRRSARDPDVADSEAR